MFTGIIETTARLVDIRRQSGNLDLTFTTQIGSELKVDQSVAHNGICLTVVAVNTNQYTVTAIAETISKTNVSHWQLNDEINLERCLQANGRFDGHIVQGHVDETAVCHNIEQTSGSWLFTFKISSEENSKLLVNKGSICINGVSLTVVSCTNQLFSVAIIPYTYEHTNFKTLNIGSVVNIEFDIVGKYIAKMLGK